MCSESELLRSEAHSVNIVHWTLFIKQQSLQLSELWQSDYQMQFFNFFLPQISSGWLASGWVPVQRTWSRQHLWVQLHSVWVRLTYWVLTKNFPREPVETVGWSGEIRVFKLWTISYFTTSTSDQCIVVMAEHWQSAWRLKGCVSYAIRIALGTSQISR